ncbi:MAG: hypothetical protein ACRCUC_02240 [Aestuariivirga sp.]
MQSEMTKERLRALRNSLIGALGSHSHFIANLDEICDLALSALEGEEVWIGGYLSDPKLVCGATERQAQQAVERISDWEWEKASRKGWTVTRCRIVRV